MSPPCPHVLLCLWRYNYEQDAGDGSFVLPRRIMDEPMEKEGEYIQTMNNRGRGSGLMLIIGLLVALLIACKRQGKDRGRFSVFTVGGCFDRI